MKRYAVLFFLISITGFYSCKKNNDDAARADATGYWTGRLDRPFILVSLINHSNGNSRAYFESIVVDTSLAVKFNGKWKVENNIFYGTYTGSLFSANDTILIQAVMEPPFNELKGVLIPQTGMGFLDILLIKRE
jgi:hypothetical protein